MSRYILCSVLCNCTITGPVLKDTGHRNVQRIQIPDTRFCFGECLMFPHKTVSPELRFLSLANPSTHTIHEDAQIQRSQTQSWKQSPDAGSPSLWKGLPRAGQSWKALDHARQPGRPYSGYCDRERGRGSQIRLCWLKAEELPKKRVKGRFCFCVLDMFMS